MSVCLVLILPKIICICAWVRRSMRIMWLKIFGKWPKKVSTGTTMKTIRNELAKRTPMNTF